MLFVQDRKTRGKKLIENPHVKTRGNIMFLVHQGKAAIRWNPKRIAQSLLSRYVLLGLGGVA